jgi:hypothetical protein
VRGSGAGQGVAMKPTVTKAVRVEPDRNEYPHARRRRLIGSGLLCLLVAIVVLLVWVFAWPSPSPSSTPPPSPSHGAKLAWAPPPCGNDGFPCQDITLTNTGAHQAPNLEPNVDYRIHLPTSGPLVGGVTIVSGHNVQIIGGEIDLTYPCSDDADRCMGIYIAKHSPGAVFVEGVWIHNPAKIPATCPTAATSTAQPCSTGDAIDVNTAIYGVNPITITLENIRADGISGNSGFADHSDVFQPYQAPGDTIRVDRFTGTSNDQGFTLDPDLAWSKFHATATYDIRNTNLDVINNPYNGFHNHYMWWLTHGGNCVSGPTVLRNVYTSEADGTMSINSAWPDTNQPAACESSWSGSKLSFPHIDVTGSINEGTPPGGDFVPVGAVGINYKSPGYQ